MVMFLGGGMSNNGLNFVYKTDKFARDVKNETVTRNHPKFKEIVEAYKANKFEEVVRLIDLDKQMAYYLSSGSTEGFRVNRGIIYCGSFAFADRVSQKAVEMMAAGLPPESLYKFMLRTLKNPLPVAQTDLLLFCDANKFLISPEGAIIAFKAVRRNGMDVHSGLVDNNPWKQGDPTETVVIETNDGGVTIEIIDGIKTISMKREMVNPDRNQTCSNGLHVGASGYVNTFGGERVLVVEVAPEDMVAIPIDYNQQKARCCRYQIVGEFTTGSRKAFEPDKQVVTPYDFNQDLEVTSNMRDVDDDEDDEEDQCDGCGLSEDSCVCDDYDDGEDEEEDEEEDQTNKSELCVTPPSSAIDIDRTVINGTVLATQGFFTTSAGKEDKSAFFQWFKKQGVDLRTSQEAQDLLVARGFKSWISWLL